MNQDNNDLLFGQPKDLDEAVDTLLAFYGEEYLLKLLKDDGNLCDRLLDLGVDEFIFSAWFLRWQEGHNNPSFPLSKPPLLFFFHYVGITHPDDMIDILFSAVWHRLIGKPYNLQETIEALQDYWKWQGYPDGKPDTNAL